MFTSKKWNVRNTVSTVIAAAIVAISGLTFERGHEGSTPRGVVEVGALESVDFLPRVADLPKVVVTAPRLAMADGRTGA
jgi:hypothetical protein